MSLFRSIALPLLLASSLAAQTPPTRQVHGDTLVSPADPAASLIVAPAFRYAGGQVIDILKVAGAEQYFFIDAAPDSAIRRFYWIQFEYFYPSNSHSYNYSGIKNQKPLMLGRGVDAPMPVILLGALGGMAAGGILGMFVGATLLALGYQLFMGWVGTNRPAPKSPAEEIPRNVPIL